MRTNAPRMVTVVVAVVLTVAGLSLALYPIQPLNQLVMGAVDAVGLDLTKQRAGWFALLGSPLLLAAGSLLKGM